MVRERMAMPAAPCFSQPIPTTGHHKFSVHVSSHGADWTASGYPETVMSKSRREPGIQDASDRIGPACHEVVEPDERRTGSERGMATKLRAALR